MPKGMGYGKGYGLKAAGGNFGQSYSRYHQGYATPPKDGGMNGPMGRGATVKTGRAYGGNDGGSNLSAARQAGMAAGGVRRTANRGGHRMRAMGGHY